MLQQHRTVRLAGVVLDRFRHICTFFNSKDEEYRTLLPFVKEGFERGDRAFHIIDERLRAAHLQRLADAGIDIVAAQQQGQLEVRGWQDAYLRGGRFDQHAMLALAEDVLRAGKARGFRLTRVVACMDWALEDRPGVRDMVEYETRADAVLAQYDDAVVCTYDLARFDAAVVMEVLRTHPAAILGGALHTNPFFVPPEQCLRERRERVLGVSVPGGIAPVTSFDPQELRRGIRELIALSALPAAWQSTRAANIPGSLAEVLLRSLSAEFVCVYLNAGPEGHAVDIGRTSKHTEFDRATDVCRALRRHVRPSVDADEVVTVIPHPLAEGTARIAVQHIGPNGTTGYVMAASRRPDFPTPLDRLLMEVAGQHAAAMLQRQHAEETPAPSEALRVARRAVAHTSRLKKQILASVSNELRTAEVEWARICRVVTGGELAGLQERLDLLTPRELEVLLFVVAGLANKQVAAKLRVSEATIKAHRGRVMQKMGAKSLAELVWMCVALGIVSPIKS